LATKKHPSLEGPEWEQIFAECIGAQWKPSNVGLDDIILGACAWGAKSVKVNDPEKAKRIRLISGRNSPGFSFGETRILEKEPQIIGNEVIEIWNERVASLWKKFKHLRTIVLMKSADLSKLGVFEFETVRYETQLITWKWNARGNLEGYINDAKYHKFTWQPHGSQFTIIENVPEECLVVQVKKPQPLPKGRLLESIGYKESWVIIIKGHG